MSACDVESYRFKSYYPPTTYNKLDRYKNFKSIKIQLFIFYKKQPYFFYKFFNASFLKKNLKIFFKNTFIFFDIQEKTSLHLLLTYVDNKKIFLFLSFYRNKAIASTQQMSNTLSIGMILVSLNMFKSKFLRRTPKGHRILLNFLNFPKSIFNKRLKIASALVIFFKNVNNRFFFLKKKILKIFFKYDVSFFLINVGIPFSNFFGKKKKSIKKRLKKKIVSDFLKLI